MDRLLLAIAIFSVCALNFTTTLSLSPGHTVVRTTIAINMVSPMVANSGGNSSILSVPKVDYFIAVGSDQDHINVSLSIYVTAVEGIASVILYCKSSGAVSWNTSVMSLANGVYIITIGYFKAEDNVSYYVNATDTLGNFTCSPINAPASYYTLRVPYHSTFCPATPTNLAPEFPSIYFCIIITISGVIVVIILMYKKGRMLANKNQGFDL